MTANTVRGHLSDGRFTLAKEIPRNFPDSVSRISFRVCYLHAVNGNDQTDVFPDNPKSRDSIDVNLALVAGASYILPKRDFAFDLPSDKRLFERAWLCAALYSGSGYFCERYLNRIFSSVI